MDGVNCPGSEKRTRFEVVSRFLDCWTRRRDLDEGVDGPEPADDGEDMDGVNGGVGMSADAAPWNAADIDDVLRRVRRRAIGRSAMAMMR